MTVVLAMPVAFVRFNIVAAVDLWTENQEPKTKFTSKIIWFVCVGMCVTTATSTAS